MHTPFRLTDAEVGQLGEGAHLQREDFASPEEVRYWSASITASDRSFARAGTGSGPRRGSAARGDRTAWEEDLPGLFEGLKERFVEVRQELNESAWLGLALFDIQLATYAPGAGYETHLDTMRGDAARRVTAILYLNPDWLPAQGGCLRVHGSQGDQDIEPRGGRLVVFLSDRVRHEVLPGSATRHAATAWFRGRSHPA